MTIPMKRGLVLTNSPGARVGMHSHINVTETTQSVLLVIRKYRLWPFVDDPLSPPSLR